MIAIINTGGANLSSIMNAFERLGKDVVLTTDKQIIKNATHVILPGVGAAANCMNNLKALDLIAFIRELKVPTLGICLGMQILFSSSEEGDVDCLDIIKGKIVGFTPKKGMSVPHMGWNAIEFQKNDHPLFSGIPNGVYMYYANSFYAPIGKHALAVTSYIEDISAIVNQGNFYGMQFHPERSGEYGLKLLENFTNL